MSCVASLVAVLLVLIFTCLHPPKKHKSQTDILMDPIYLSETDKRHGSKVRARERERELHLIINIT